MHLHTSYTFTASHALTCVVTHTHTHTSFANLLSLPPAAVAGHAASLSHRAGLCCGSEDPALLSSSLETEFVSAITYRALTDRVVLAKGGGEAGTGPLLPSQAASLPHAAELPVPTGGHFLCVCGPGATSYVGQSQSVTTASVLTGPEDWQAPGWNPALLDAWPSPLPQVGGVGTCPGWKAPPQLGGGQ